MTQVTEYGICVEDILFKRQISRRIANNNTCSIKSIVCVVDRSNTVIYGKLSMFLEITR